MKEFIAAIELGSSKIVGIAGERASDGSYRVLAIQKEDATDIIKRGVVYNIDKATTAITTIVKSLSRQLGQHIAQVYVGVGGQSIRSVKNTIARDLPADTMVTTDIVIELMDANRSTPYPDLEILDATTQEYRVDSQTQRDPVGIKCQHLEANFLNILGRKKFYENLNQCFERAEIQVAELFLAPLALADCTLTEAERRAGCALVDIGADTTTVCVYSQNVLRHLTVIPLGSANITKDIASLQIDEAEAEKLKLSHGSLEAGDKDNAASPTAPIVISGDRTLDAEQLADIVECRSQEIIRNVWYQVPAEYAQSLIGGIILTGGGSRMPGICKAFSEYTHVEKVRLATFVNQTVTSKPEVKIDRDGTLNTVLSLIIKGNINCAGRQLNPEGSLFDDIESDLSASAAGQTQGERARKPGEVPAGVVLTAAEKKRAEEEARRRAESSPTNWLKRHIKTIWGTINTPDE